MVSLDESYDMDDGDDGTEMEVQMGTTGSGRKRLFSKELRCMMYGFGDDQNPYTESVDLLEDLAIEFLTQMVTTSLSKSKILYTRSLPSATVAVTWQWLSLFHNISAAGLDGLDNNMIKTHKAMEIGRTGRVQVEDIIFLVRKNARKYARVKDLLTMNEELKKARKAFDEVKFAVTTE